MLVNCLKLHQRGGRRFASGQDIVTFQNNMTRLHADDQAVLLHFGLDRQQLVAYVNEPANVQPLPPDSETILRHLQEQLARLDSISVQAKTIPSNNEHFYWFDYRFFLYFIDVFKADERYSDASAHIDEQTFFPSLESHCHRQD
ncbi:hypothetical protein [Pseudomonas hefeiensis]|uniref:Uncharacterized protein n=1 Tax=Pseudomonas hefeiensis TaxID=2738125 RepID=A0ABY9G8P3_9PSED|nr:hypothetical protein [Pseudomonas sp. FP205]WLH12006.1 hypothetical protein PSH57_24745 [Pseudomonas sp. FP205]